MALGVGGDAVAARQEGVAGDLADLALFADARSREAAAEGVRLAGDKLKVSLAIAGERKTVAKDGVAT